MVSSGCGPGRGDVPAGHSPIKPEWHWAARPALPRPTAWVLYDARRSIRIAAPFMSCAALVAGLTTVLLHPSGGRSQLALSAGTAWFAEPSYGTASLMDGSTVSGGRGVRGS